MSRLKIRWVLTRVALIMTVLLLFQFVSQLGLMKMRGPDCVENQKVFNEFARIRENPERFVENVAQVKTNTDFTKIAKNMKQSDSKSAKDLQNIVGNLKRLALELSETRRTLIRSALQYHRVGQHIESLNDIIESLGGESFSQHDANVPVGKFSLKNSASSSKKEVCPEKFMGKSLAYGYPYFRKGFQRVNCAEFVPIHLLVTVLLVLPEELSDKKQFQFFQGVAQYYPGISIFIASTRKFPVETLAKLNLNIKNVVFAELTHGKTWTKLLQEVTTPYVLLASDVTHFDDDVDLERLVRVLSDNKNAVVAGGSLRNQEGEWDIGCLQVTFRNWTAYFRGGYYHSFSECVVCDVLCGPFMAKTEELRKIGLDEK